MKSKSQIKFASKFLLLISVVALTAAGCNTPKTNTLKRPVDNIDANNPSNDNSNSADNKSSQTNSDNGQVAGTVTPLPSKKIKVAGHELNVEVADNETTREQGLSDRPGLDDGAGMLFDFTNTTFRNPGFYMKDMLFSIDIIWINNGKVIGVLPNAPLPVPDQDLPVYYPPSEVNYVLEVPAGWYAKNNITTGSRVEM